MLSRAEALFTVPKKHLVYWSDADQRLPLCVMAGVPALVTNRVWYTGISACIAVFNFSQNDACLLRVRTVEWLHTRN